MYWSTPPNQAWVAFFMCSTTTDGVFVQNGYFYNGLDIPIRLVGGNTLIPAHSWAMFWMYYKPGIGYVGNGVLPPAGWSAYNPIYFSVAIYPSSGCVSFMFTKGSTGAQINVKVYPQPMVGFQATSEE